MLILECSQRWYAVKIWPLDLWPWKSIVFQTLLRTMYVPSLVKILLRMLIQESSQGCYVVKIWPSDIDLWPEKSIVFQILQTKHVPSLVKIHWRMLILVFTRMLHGKKFTQWPWPWKAIGFQTLLRTKYIPSLVKIHWRMLILECSQGCFAVKIWPADLDLTLKINRVPDSLKD
jgi:hypothetical protein